MVSPAELPEIVLDTSADDLVLPFSVEGLDVRGRVVRLGGAIDQILGRHGYPERVAALLAEAVALTLLLGSSLKIEGRFILQVQTDGPVSLLVADLTVPGTIRGYASFDAEAVEAEPAGDDLPQRLLGRGNLAMTVDPGAGMRRYQGIVALDGVTLQEAAHTYFRQSEQIPTTVRISAGPIYHGGRDPGTGWRAGGIIIQHMPEGGPGRSADLHPGDAPEGAEVHEWEEPDEWTEARLLLETVEMHELLDPSIAVGRLLLRLYHERGVRVYDPVEVMEDCSCSREKILGVLRGFPEEERSEMVTEDGTIEVTCEFCSTRYTVDPSEL
ncbi:Hsp33 family molecular chaperone [Lutibaculum baratangense]|uniref:Chaperone protein Hsp33 n=1 Tax=Lutibaculum baratangense AMV1 TaxID=631454 RepID=V4TP10_9HYPH|nr:Hsp33 family molecular chaperone [Lutibaculum baratangense]ESR27413.1 Chaperone protein Hsp33 [Lutibaculum baratangense AMV1]